MRRRPPRNTRTDTLFPYTTLFRSISAYGEGWGLYSEDLGVEMGIYETPYEDLGRLTYAMWRACRLVIDTGIHHMGWRSEEHTSELQSLMRISYAVFCLKQIIIHHSSSYHSSFFSLFFHSLFI